MLDKLVMNADGFAIAWAYDTTNANLIAAAPELLYAAKYCLEYLGKDFWDESEYYEMLRGAIAKAEGKSE